MFLFSTSDKKSHHKQDTSLRGTFSDTTIHNPGPSEDMPGKLRFIAPAIYPVESRSMTTHSTLSAPQAALQPVAVSLDAPRRSTALLIITGLWLAIFFAALFSPPLLDDADATHANAARNMALVGDYVTLKVNGIRYLEKAPLPYWLDAISFRTFGFNAFAAHLPEALGVLLLALLGYVWSRRAYGDRAALYAGLAVLTSAGVF